MTLRAWTRGASAGVLTALSGAVLAPTAALAAGLGNLTYTAAELQKPIANFGGESAGKWPSGPTGSNTLLMLRDVCIIMGSNDSGKPPGSFHFYDLKDPRKPVLLNTYGNTPETSHLRELHAMPVAVIDGKDYMVAPTTTGLQFFDFTDPMHPAPAGSVELGVNAGDYDNTVWMVSWAWPYVYAGSTGSGVFVVDATDPMKPVEIKSSRVASGDLGNFRVGPTYAAGNYLVVANMDQATTHFSVIDAGDPKAKKPNLLTTATANASLYSMLVVGDRIYGAGTNGDYVFMKWSPTAITPLKSGKDGSDRGGYCTYQSGYAICGQSSEGYKKWDTRDENAPKLVGHGTDPNGPGGDFDFATVVGNLVYMGNDHGSGAALVPHVMEPDTVAPQVAKIYPSNGDTKQPLSTRITAFFSEDIDLASVSVANLKVRTSAGVAVDNVVFSKSSFNAISIGFKQPLTANTTYEVSVTAGGLKDIVGNPIAEASAIRFSTGATVDGAVIEPGTGGSSAGGTAPLPEAGATSGAGAGAGGVTAAGAGGTGPIPIPFTGGSSGTGSSGAGTAGSPSAAPGADDAAGCGCSVPGSSLPSRAAWLFPLAAWLLASRRSRAQSRKPRSHTGA